jgi:hypothetical protein
VSENNAIVALLWINTPVRSQLHVNITLLLSGDNIMSTSFVNRISLPPIVKLYVKDSLLNLTVILALSSTKPTATLHLIPKEGHTT